MARKKSLQKLLEEYECEGQLSLFDLDDQELSKSLCNGSDYIPFSSEPIPEVKGKARRRVAALEQPNYVYRDGEYFCKKSPSDLLW